MPKSKPVTLQLECEEKKSITGPLQISEWERSDGMMRAGFGVGGVLLLTVMMIPIPIVHFAAIPVLLFGLPLVSIITFRMYSKGTDLQGTITCPECSTNRKITMSVEYWPVSIQCLGCKKYMSLTQLD